MAEIVPTTQILSTLGGFVVRCAQLEQQLADCQQQVAIEQHTIRVLREELEAAQSGGTR